MPFQPGHKLSKGRPKGSINRRSWDARETLERLNFDPLAALHEIYQEAAKIYKNYAVIHEAIIVAKSNEQGYPAVVEDKSHQYLKIAMDAARELAGYSHPKLKSIEHVKGGPLDGMTPEQRLEAMKQATKALEMQINEKNKDGPADAGRSDAGSLKISSTSE